MIGVGIDKMARAENDAWIISQYLEIMKDKERVKLAGQYAEKEVAKIQERLNAMKQVAKKKGGK